MENFILDTDSYKLSHYLGYPQTVTKIHSYAESRGGIYPATVFLGLQRFVRDLAATTITNNMIDEAEDFARVHGEPFNRSGWELIVHKYGGKIPVTIRGVAEGTLVPTRNVLATVVNDDPALPWLTSYIETALLRSIWYPTTVATRIHYMKQQIFDAFRSTADDFADLGFALLDFSLRGCSSRETAEIGGLGHLVHFIGSDNIPAIVAARKYYDADMAAFSVPATEHSVTTAYARDAEPQSIDNLLSKMLVKNGILSLVGDTWDIFNFTRTIIAKWHMIDSIGGTVVIRPDSGNMREVLPLIFALVRDNVPNTRNAKGFLVPKRIKILQGDGINERNVGLPFALAKDSGLAANAVMVGSGGGLMQSSIDRDTCKFAFKASAKFEHGQWIGISKNPITDPGKKSKEGVLSLHIDDSGNYVTSDQNVCPHTNLLVPRYQAGRSINETTLNEIRKRTDSNFQI